MGTFEVTAKLPDGSGVEALVDTGCTFSKIDDETLRRLGVQPSFSGKVKIGDGSLMSRQIGYVTLTLNGRSALVPVVFGQPGESPLIGATTLEILGFAADPVAKRLLDTPYLEM